MDFIAADFHQKIDPKTLFWLENCH